MNFYFIRNGQGKNSLLTKHHLYCLDLISGKFYFRKAMVSLLPFYFFNFYRGETLITVYMCMTFCGIIELYKKRKYYFTVDTN